MTIVRMGPSGKRLQPSAANGLRGWDGSAPVSFVVVPAPHTPAIYSFTISTAPIVLAVSGTLTITAFWSNPGVGPRSLIYSNGAQFNAGFRGPRQLISDGTAPIEVLFTPNAIVGSPSLNIDVPADFIFATLPEDFPR